MDFAKVNLAEHRELARIIVSEAVKRHFRDREEFQKFRNSVIKSRGGKIFHNLYFLKAYEDLLKEGRISANQDFLRLIQKRSIRTLSGVAPVTVMTKAFPCPGRCVYCPSDVRMPKSYLPSQPAAQRGFRQKFDPYAQTFVRLKALHMTGHEVSKVDLRIIGGTWNSYPKRYQKWFVKRCLQAMNDFSKRIGDERAQGVIRRSKIRSNMGVDKVNTLYIGSLAARGLKFESVVKENENAAVRCIGINVETRPDFINGKEVCRLRELGVTKVEIGVQTTFDAVQKLTKRGHNLSAVRRATEMLKDAGLKLSYHMMPNLPGSTPEMDKKMIHEIFDNPSYKPDFLKIYPCVVIAGTELSKSYRAGEFQPYNDETLEDILMDNLLTIPEYCRLDRMARDIPATDIEAGTKSSNIRQLLEEKLAAKDWRAREIRSREIMNKSFRFEDVQLIERQYEASGGKEFFLSFEDVLQDKLIALLRLRFPGRTYIRELDGAALIREVHVYGRQIAVGEKGKEKKQHVGWGRKLIEEAETRARKCGYKKIAVISGIGTREYYRKLGYELEGTYMVKRID